jgi:hypothetical protein
VAGGVGGAHEVFNFLLRSEPGGQRDLSLPTGDRLLHTDANDSIIIVGCGRAWAVRFGVADGDRDHGPGSDVHGQGSSSSEPRGVEVRHHGQD